MEDQGVQSPQNFLVKKFFFLQPPRKHDRRFKAAFWTSETKMVMYIITSKLNSTFGTIGKATGIKMTARAVATNLKLSR